VGGGEPVSVLAAVRFLFLNQFYPPDLAPTGRYLHDVAAELVRRGHEVRVFSARRAYGTGEDLGPGQVLDGVDVRRVRTLSRGNASFAGRATGHLVYFARAATHAVRTTPRPDVIVAATSPPFLGLAAAVANRCRGVAHAEWAMDLYPDVIQAHWIRRHAWLHRLLDAVARFQLRRADLVLTLGASMAARMRRHVSADERVESVQLWAPAASPEAEVVSPWRVRRGWDSEDLVLLYSGNMGRGHTFVEFLEAARRLGEDGPLWAFVGSGPRRSALDRFREAHPAARVQLLPSVGTAEVTSSLRSADVHLVSLSTAWEGLVIPSKMQAAFSVGRPVIFVGPLGSDAARWIHESGGGWVVAEGDVDGLLRAVEEARDAGERARRARAALDYARVHFDADRNRARVADLLEGCGADGGVMCLTRASGR
jgi:colanic acid biosynthesis glycosyl transferase WcaI